MCVCVCEHNQKGNHNNFSHHEKGKEQLTGKGVDGSNEKEKDSKESGHDVLFKRQKRVCDCNQERNTGGAG